MYLYVKYVDVNICICRCITVIYVHIKYVDVNMCTYKYMYNKYIYM